MKTIDYNASNWYDDSLLINVDPNWYRWYDMSSAESVVISAKENALRYADHKVTDVLYCIFEQTSIVPSEKWMWRGSKFHMKEENGVPVDYSEHDGVRNLYDIYEKYNIDVYQIMLDTLRENGIRPWVTLRMNDCHFNGDPTAFIRSDYYYEADEKGYKVSANGSNYGYFNHCLNYSVPEVREKMLDYIKELLDKYDAFGYELDFMREIYSFDHEKDSNCCEIMNEFMRQVNDLIDIAEQKWGHDIKLMVRVPRSIEASVAYGFDVRYWVENGLVDSLVPSPRWEVSDSCIPAAEWMALVDGKDIAVFPCVETLNLKYTFTTAEISKAYAASWYSQGADGLYAYNHMDYSPLQSELWDFDREYCINSERKFVVTFQDIAPKGVEKYRPLPMKLEQGRNSIELNLGEINAEDDVILTFGLEDTEKIPSVRLNGTAPDSVDNKGRGYISGPAEDGSGDKVLSDGLGIVCAFKNFETVGDVLLTFDSEDVGSVDYIDFKIIPKK